MEIKIPKEVRQHSETIFFGLSMEPGRTRWL